MKTLSLIILLIADFALTNAQDFSLFKKYKYIAIPSLKYDEYADDAWGVSNYLATTFKEAGFEVLKGEYKDI